jgi:hypothetical protein
VHQHFNASEDEPLVLVSAQNRLIEHLGYDQVIQLEEPSPPAPAPLHAPPDARVDALPHRACGGEDPEEVAAEHA